MIAPSLLVALAPLLLGLGPLDHPRVALVAIGVIARASGRHADDLGRLAIAAELVRATGLDLDHPRGALGALEKIAGRGRGRAALFERAGRVLAVQIAELGGRS